MECKEVLNQISLVTMIRLYKGYECLLTFRCGWYRVRLYKNTIMAKKHGERKIKLSMCKSAMSLWAEISHFFKKMSSEVCHPEKSEDFSYGTGMSA